MVTKRIKVRATLLAPEAKRARAEYVEIGKRRQSSPKVREVREMRA